MPHPEGYARHTTHTYNFTPPPATVFGKFFTMLGLRNPVEYRAEYSFTMEDDDTQTIRKLEAYHYKIGYSYQLTGFGPGEELRFEKIETSKKHSSLPHPRQGTLPAQINYWHDKTDHRHLVLHQYKEIDKDHIKNEGLLESSNFCRIAMCDGVVHKVSLHDEMGYKDERDEPAYHSNSTRAIQLRQLLKEMTQNINQVLAVSPHHAKLPDLPWAVPQAA